MVATALVDDFFVHLELREEVREGDRDGRIRAKRRRLEQRAVKDQYEGERKAAVKATRACIMQMLTHGRTEVRRQLFEHLLFPVYKISSFGSTLAAKEAGFEFEIPDAQEGGQLEICDLEEDKASRWHVASTETASESSAAIDERNLAAFSKLQEDFPELTVKLKYVKNVRKPSRSTENDGTVADENLTWATVENVSLHSVASAMILAAYKIDTFPDILRSCELSLCVIHVFAIGLRALLKQSIGLELEPLEKCALGDVTAKLLEKGDTTVSAMYGGATRDKDDDDESLLKKIRRAKFEMSWESHMAEEAKAQAALRPRSDSFRSTMVHCASDEDGDDDEELMFKSGSRMAAIS